MKSRIAGFENVVRTVGFETTFHDSEVLRLQLERLSGKANLTISLLTRRSLWPAEKDASEPLHYIVQLKFRDIEDLELEGFNHQNVIAEMIQSFDKDRLTIRFAGLFGLDCSFSCKEGEVVSIEQTDMQLGAPFSAGHSEHI